MSAQAIPAPLIETKIESAAGFVFRSFAAVRSIIGWDGTSASQQSTARSAPSSAGPYLAESDLLTEKDQAAIDNANISPQAKALLAAALIAENRDKRLGIKRTSMEEQTEQLMKKHDEDARRYVKENELEKARAEAENAAARKRDQLREERRRAATQCKDRKEIEILRHLEATGSPPDGSQDRSSSFWAECHLENL